MVYNFCYAVLIIGPTGSGKSPLGDHFERALGYAHFDFGHLLREAVRDESSVFTGEELSFIKWMLENKALLPKERFIIAEKLLKAFIEKNKGKRLVLNGFPRAVHQAEQIAKFIDVQKVIYLNCSKEVVLKRVGKRKLGLSDDHSGRTDDELQDIELKLKIFEKNTLPLIEWYRSQGVEIVKSEVKMDTQPEDHVKSVAAELALLKQAKQALPLHSIKK